MSPTCNAKCGAGVRASARHCPPSAVPRRGGAADELKPPDPNYLRCVTEPRPRDEENTDHDGSSGRKASNAFPGAALTQSHCSPYLVLGTTKCGSQGGSPTLAPRPLPPLGPPPPLTPADAPGVGVQEGGTPSPPSTATPFAQSPGGGRRRHLPRQSKKIFLRLQMQL